MTFNLTGLNVYISVEVSLFFFRFFFFIMQFLVCLSALVYTVCHRKVLSLLSPAYSMSMYM